MFTKLVNLLIRPNRSWKPQDHVEFVTSKFDRIDNLIDGKDVLDCGCVGDQISSKEDFDKSSNGIHAAHAKYILGVDIWEEEIKKRQELGLNVVCANVETMDLNRTFDAIIAGDLIEHLANPGLFLEKANKHLNNGGLLYLCTPNPWSLNIIMKSVFGMNINVNPEHCSWFDFKTLNELLSRYDFCIKERYWQDYCKKKTIKHILKMRPNLSTSIIVIAEKIENS
ncbi:class I SAM-dependent methyltransferase [Methanolobus sp. WCC5]|uniref:class I SAM-dependent methyltransferase n=1 Tax=Methanolobus sp. WCC5 TaxID=3125785 RepID=UPI0032433F77